MNLRPTQRSFVSLESVAMTDIVMNLFIFFFISFSLLYTFNPDKSKEAKIEVKLPEGASDAAAGDESPLVVFVTSGSEVYIGDKRVPPASLKKEFASRASALQAAGVVVKADKSASVDALVRVLDSAKRAGIRKLGVAVDAKKPS